MENPNYPRALISMVENDLNDEVRVKALAAISSESQIRCNHSILIDFNCLIFKNSRSGSSKRNCVSAIH